MSSHHVVRDEQEPALLLLDHQIDTEFLGSLLEWSPTIIINADDAKEVRNKINKVDVVIGTEDSIHAAEEILKYQVPVHYITISHSYNFLSEALSYLYRTNHRAVNIVGDLEERRSNLQIDFPKIDIVHYHDGKKWVYIKGTFKKWYPKAVEINWSDAAEVVFATEKMAPEISSLKTKEEGFLEVTSHKGVWLGETI